MSPRAWPLGRRLAFAAVVAYLAAFVLELSSGGSKPDAVGWRDPWLALSTQGFVMGLVGGWVGVVLAPVPFLLTPETVRWIRDALVDLRRGETFLAYAALFYLVPLVLAIYAAGLTGAVVGWLFWGRRRRS
jgi:hypothetical protein